MTDASGRYAIVFNGEIFNFRELKKDLLAKGVRFRSESDTEILLYLFIHEKQKCLEKLDGEFAFAIYDKEEESIFLARDRFGIKPLYYYADADKFLFASGLNAILAFGVPRELDEASLQTYLHLNYIPAPDTIYVSVKKFPAASFAEITNSSIHPRQYYRTTITQGECAYEKAEQHLHRLLEESVQKRMIADVPLGCFLSGGIDSSVISALASRHARHLKTFSIGYRDEKLFDETRYASLVAKKIRSEHTVFSLSDEDLFGNLHTMLDQLEEPFADSSALAVHILSMHTRKHVKVALSGDGADEIFGGYNKHAAELRARKGGMAVSLVKSSGKILKTLPGSRNTKLGNRVRQLHRFSEGARLNEQERYWHWAGSAGEKEVEKLYAKGNAESQKRKQALLASLSSDYNTVLLTDLRLVLENDMLVKTDRMSMANSLEVRVPYLAHEVVDFAFSLPAAYKIDGKRRKKVLKDAFRKELPEEIFHRGKQGFEVPLLKWFRTGLRTMITDDLLSEKFVKEQNIFNNTQSGALLKQLFSGNPGDSVARVWGLIVFQYWWKKHHA